MLNRGSAATGLGQIKVKIKRFNNSLPTLIFQKDIPESVWAGAVANFTINTSFPNSDVENSGSIIFLEYSTYLNFSYSSCQIPIIKTSPPSAFTLTPTSISLSCNDLMPKTFSVIGANIPSNSNVTYQWSFNGWSGSSGSSSSKVLTPLSGTLLPSNVIVTPFIDGVAKPTMTCLISRATTTDNSVISGNSTLCSGSSAVYSLSGFSGGNSVVWSTSNNLIATVSNIAQNSVTVNSVSNGAVTLKAAITNACGQVDVITKPIYIGMPYSMFTINGGFDNVSVYSGGAVSITPVFGATSYTWSVVPVQSQCGCTVNSSGSISCPRGIVLPKFTANNQTTFTTTGTQVSINWGNCKGNYILKCVANNSCGAGLDSVKSVYVYGTNNGGYNPCPTTMKVNNNPLKNNELNISLRTAPGNPCNNTNDRRLLKNEVFIFDMYGAKVFNSTFTSDEINVKNLNLKKGNYILNVITLGGNNHKQVIVVE